MAHAYLLEGDRESSISAVRAYAEMALGIQGEQHPDLIVLQYGLFSVDDAREVARFASSSPVRGDTKMVVIATTRIFHEAQNALLKLFEEPPAGVTMALIVPSIGQILPTLLSRVQVLTKGSVLTPIADEFLSLDTVGREKHIAKMLEKTKAEKDEDKQTARADLLKLVEEMLRTVYDMREKAGAKEQEELTLLLDDLSAFLPILHERSAPLKLIFEHLLLVLPKSKTA